MRRKLMTLAVVLTTLVLAAGAGTAAGEDGNTAVGSTGTAQIGSTGVAPPVDVSAAGATATAAAPTATSGAGNAATGSVGTAQVGGQNAANSSVGTAQAASAASAPSATATGPGGSTSVATSSPVSIGGGQNTADRSVATAQVGGDNTTGQSLVTVQASSVDATPSASLSAADELFAVRLSVSIPPGANTARDTLGSVQLGGDSPASGAVEADLAGEATALVGAALDEQLHSASDSVRAVIARVAGVEIGVDAEGANLRGEALFVTPEVFLTLEPVGSFALGGTIGVAASDESSAERSFATVQTGPLVLSPTASASTAVGTATLGGASTAGTPGASRATGSVATVQVGGGNSADGSTGTAQSGPVVIAPWATVTGTPTVESTEARPSATVGGNGTNAAEDSAGTVQVGRGNSSKSAIGTSQLGPLRAAATTPAGQAGVGSSGGNRAEGAVGTLQVGGGNRSSESAATSQFGGLEAASTTFGGGENVAENSIGTLQVGGGNFAQGSNGTLQVFGARGSSESTPVGEGLEAAASVSESPRPAEAADGVLVDTPVAPDVAQRGAPPSRSAPTDTLQVQQAIRRTARTGELPFTGLSLLAAAFLGLALAVGGVTLRARVRPS